MAYKFYVLCLMCLCLTGCGTVSITANKSKLELATTPATRVARFISDTKNRGKFDDQEISGDRAHASFKIDASRYEVTAERNSLRIQVYARSEALTSAPDREVVDDAMDGTVDYGVEVIPSRNGSQPKTVDQYKKFDSVSETKWQPYYQLVLIQIIDKYQLDKK